MGPEEETVEEARQRYLAALRHRQEASDQARRAEWNRQTKDVESARKAYREAQLREDRETTLSRIFKKVAEL